MNNHPETNPNADNREKKKLKKIATEVWFWVLGILAFIAAIALFWKKAEKKIYKWELYKPYYVDKKTFSQWITLFCSDIISKEEYAKCRKLTMSVVTEIRNRLGEETDETPVMSKKGIIGMADGSYITLRRSIERYPEQFGITPSVFKSLNSFPPKIAARILYYYQNGVQKEFNG